MKQINEFLLGVVVSFMILGINTQGHAVERMEDGLAIQSTQNSAALGRALQTEQPPIENGRSTISELAPPGLESRLSAEASHEIAPPNVCRADPPATDSEVSVSRGSVKHTGKRGPTKIGEVVGVDLDSGRHAATEAYVASVYSHVLSIEGSIWTILHFEGVSLGPDDYIELTSLEDGASEQIRSDRVTDGEVYSAAFNGDVRVELNVGPGSSGSGFRVAEAAVGVRPAQGEGASFQICPAGDDDRTLTTDARVCAILDGPMTTNQEGTGWFIEGGTQDLPCMLTAGHVIDGITPGNPTGADRIWCDVPCPFAAPLPASQFTISSVEGFENDGLACSPKDWAVLFITGTPGRPFFTLTNGPVGLTAQTGVRGYGVDSDTPAQTQCLQKDNDIGQRTGDEIFHDVDTESLSSGSPILFPHFDPDAKGWAIHTGFATSGDFCNCGTWVHYAPLRAKIQERCFSFLAIELVSLDAIASAAAVTLSWETASEVDNEGFYLLRDTDPDGPFEDVSGFIPAEGGPAFGADYAFVDDWVEAGVTYYYLLEDIDTFGVSTLHGADACTVGSDPDCEPLAVTVPGLSADEYCAEQEIRRRGFWRGSGLWACFRADWKDNEPDRRFPNDCTIARDRGSRSLICGATENAD